MSLQETSRFPIVPMVSFALALALSALGGTAARSSFARQAGGATCDWIRLPVCIRPLKAKPLADGSVPAGGSSTQAVPAGLEAAVNALWKTCCIEFQFRMGEAFEVDGENFTNGRIAVANSDGQVIKPNRGTEALFKATAQGALCLNLFYAADIVAGGLPEGADLKGVASLTGNGMIVDDGVGGPVVAHEAGHVLGLPHHQDDGNLMSGNGTGSQGASLQSPQQCNPARARARKHLRDFARAGGR